MITNQPTCSLQGAFRLDFSSGPRDITRRYLELLSGIKARQRHGFLPKVTQLGSGSWVLKLSLSDLRRLLIIAFASWLSDPYVVRSFQGKVGTCWS